MSNMTKPANNTDEGTTEKDDKVTDERTDESAVVDGKFDDEFVHYCNCVGGSWSCCNEALCEAKEISLAQMGCKDCDNCELLTNFRRYCGDYCALYYNTTINVPECPDSECFFKEMYSK